MLLVTLTSMSYAQTIGNVQNRENAKKKETVNSIVKERVTFNNNGVKMVSGEPRFLEAPAERVEDIKSAIDYLTTLPFVDQNKIGAVGICAGSGYSINAAMTDKRIKAVAGVSGTDPGAAIREGWSGDADMKEQIKILGLVGQERTAVANGAKPSLGTYVPEAIDPKAPVTMNEAYTYYRTPSHGLQLCVSS